MPFIPQHRRDEATTRPVNIGELTFQLYQDVLLYLNGARAWNKYAEVLGALEGAKACFLHDHVLPYEMSKKKENGDVL